MRYRGTIPNAESLGRVIQQGRLLRGLSQRDLADRLGISQRSVWEIESGRPNRHTDRIFTLMREVGVTLNAEVSVPVVGADTDRTGHD